MRISRAPRPAVLHAAALLLTITGVAASTAAPAFADSGATVQRVTTGDDGTLAVVLDDPSALWVKISVRASTAPDAPVLASTDEVEYSESRGWYTRQPVRLPEGTAYGDYPVDVDYRMPGGTTQHWSGNSLDYRKHTVVATAAFDRGTTDYDHRTLGVSGTVTTFDPATGTTVPAAPGVAVLVYWLEQDGYLRSKGLTATTAADGTFRQSVTVNGALSEVSTYVRGGQSADAAPDSPMPLPNVPAEQLTYRISADPSAARVHKGVAFGIRGTVQRLTADGWKPFAGASVLTGSRPVNTSSHVPSGVMGSGTANASGAFAYSATASVTTTHYTYVKPNGYFSSFPQVQHQLSVPTSGSFSGMKMSIDAYGKVKATGRLSGSCSAEKLALQYSKNGSTGWSTFKTAAAAQKSGSTCSFSISEYGWLDGYYRVHHDESNAMLAADSGKSRLRRTDTRFAAFDMTPNSPRLGGALTAKGTVQYKSGSTWKAYKGARIVIVFKPKGESTWYWAVKGKTDSSGRFSLRTKAYGDGTWGAYLEADSTHFYSESKDEYVNAR
ncbi:MULTISPECIES: hypothetical protein [unclassified Streptomyces]|uniref:hypothetical protein n=1 Tax=unclassified Streptomyces TaxID=2593676 RepID=UPI0038187F53